MSPNSKVDLERRTKAFALRVVRFVGTLPKGKPGDTLGSQLLKSGSAVGASYREANRAESRSDFLHKIGATEKEAAETRSCLEILSAAGIGNSEECRWLLQESGELLAIFANIGRINRPGRH